VKAITQMSGLTEHLKFSENKVDMLKVLTNKFVSQEYWARVEEIVQDYTRVHPIEMEITVRQNRLKQIGAFTKWGESKEKGGSEIRLGMSMPLLLIKTLEEFDPEILTNPRKKQKFGQRYKGLCTYAGK